MPKSKYDIIFKDLKEKIESAEYEEGSYLPSENTLIKEYDCSRNTVRRAISHLVTAGYVQPHHGKGVRVILSPNHRKSGYDFYISGMEGYSATAARYGYKVKTRVITFTDMKVDEHLSQKTGFPVGSEVFFIQRIRSLDGIPKMVDTNLLRKDIVVGLNREIARNSLFAYYSKELGIELTTIKRKVTVERATPFDERYLDLEDYNCLAVLTSRCYDQNGTQFEYTESRNRPDIFKFNSVITRNVNTV